MNNNKYLIVLFTVVAVALLVLVTSNPHTAAEDLAGKRTCQKVNNLMTKTGGTIEPPLTVADCIAANQDCEKRWGLYAVWAGASGGNNEPICSCDEGYVWRNNDGTTGTSFGTSSTFDFINAPGKCIKR